VSNKATELVAAARGHETGDAALINLLGALADEVERLERERSEWAGIAAVRNRNIALIADERDRLRATLEAIAGLSGWPVSTARGRDRDPQTGDRRAEASSSRCVINYRGTEMTNKHPMGDKPVIQITRHANGTAVGTAYDMRRDTAMAVDDVHVFTSFKELCAFLKGWWPEAGKE